MKLGRFSAERRLSQEAFAAEVGVSLVSVGHWITPQAGHSQSYTGRISPTAPLVSASPAQMRSTLSRSSAADPTSSAC
jgi:hypothetical protein